MTVLKTFKGDEIVVNIESDVCFYKTPRNLPNNQYGYTAGTDIYGHKEQSGVMHYYIYDWSTSEDMENEYNRLSNEEVQDYLRDKVTMNRLSNNEIRIAEEYFSGIFDNMPG